MKNTVYFWRNDATAELIRNEEKNVSYVRSKVDARLMVLIIKRNLGFPQFLTYFSRDR